MSSSLVGASRCDAYKVSPKLLILNEQNRGRVAAPSERQIVNLAISLYQNGQLQNLEVRPTTVQNPDTKEITKNVPLVTYGYNRTLAGRLLVDGFTVPADWMDSEVVNEDPQVKTEKPVKPGQFIQQADFTLMVNRRDCNDQEAFERNILENVERNATSDIDDAHNHRRLRDLYNYSDADIVRLYKYNNQTIVSQLKKLLPLPHEIQMMVHTGAMSRTAALDLVDRPSSEWEAIIAAATDANGKVKGALVREIVRDSQLADVSHADQIPGHVAGLTSGATTEGTDTTTDTDDGPKISGAKPRNVSDMRRFCTQRLPGDKQLYEFDANSEAFLKALLRFVNGHSSEVQFENAMARFSGETKTGEAKSSKKASEKSAA